MTRVRTPIACNRAAIIDPGMARSHHHNFGLVVLEASSPLDLVEPVFSGVLDLDALAAVRVDRFRMSVQALQGRHQPPCPILTLIASTGTMRTTPFPTPMDVEKAKMTSITRVPPRTSQCGAE